MRPVGPAQTRGHASVPHGLLRLRDLCQVPSAMALDRESVPSLRSMARPIPVARSCMRQRVPGRRSRFSAWLP